MSPEAPLHYPSDLTESQRAVIERFLPEPKSGPGKPGRPGMARGRLLNALLYVAKTGCQWRQLPREFGPWPTVYGYFNRWSCQEVWRGVREELTALERVRQGRHPEPTAGRVDSQSVKTATQGTEVGFDGGKQVKGRKRHGLTDTLGLLLGGVVTAANPGDREGLKALLQRWFILGVCRRRTLWGDAGYSGQALKDWVRGLKRTHKIDLEVVEHQGKGFQVVPKRWVVERAFAWLLPFRRPSKDYEVLTRNSEAMIQIAMCSILIRRLA
jgi:putative transposase